MKPLPDLNDSAAMLRLGKERALWAARKDAIIVLRDTYTAMQNADWERLEALVHQSRDAEERLLTLAAAYREL